MATPRNRTRLSAHRSTAQMTLDDPGTNPIGRHLRKHLIALFIYPPILFWGIPLIRYVNFEPKPLNDWNLILYISYFLTYIEAFFIFYIINIYHVRAISLYNIIIKIILFLFSCYALYVIKNIIALLIPNSWSILGYSVSGLRWVASEGYISYFIVLYLGIGVYLSYFSKEITAHRRLIIYFCKIHLITIYAPSIILSIIFLYSFLY